MEPYVLSIKDLAIKIREHEEEITQLRKHLADYSVKVQGVKYFFL